jgi:hypothetical protein
MIGTTMTHAGSTSFMSHTNTAHHKLGRPPASDRTIETKLQQLQLLHPRRRFSRRSLSEHTGINFLTLTRIERTALLKLRVAVRSFAPRAFDELKVSNVIA